MKEILTEIPSSFFSKKDKKSKNKIIGRGAWNKCGGGAKVAKLLNVEVGINVEGGIFWKKLVHKSNKRGVEGGKI